MTYNLVDTNILVDSFRDVVVARDFLNSLGAINISFVTLLELLKGSRNKRELADLVTRLTPLEIIYITQYTQELALDIYKKHKLLNGMEILDAVIAATAVENELTLFTRNTKHYKSIKDLKVINPFL